jgi:hypothetical protein
LALTLQNWTNDSTRFAALALQDGIYVRASDPTKRYLGTIRGTSVTGQCEDSAAKRFVWNYYNQVPRVMECNNATPHTYNGAWRKWNNADTGNLMEFVCGINGVSSYSLKSQLKAGADASFAALEPRLTGTPMYSGYADVENYNAFDIAAGGLVKTFINLSGYNTYQVYEVSNHVSSTFSFLWQLATVMG